MTKTPADEHTDPEPSTAIRRRTVLAGAAWTIPAVALATSTPAYAQTGGPAPTLTFSQAPASTPACSPTTSPFVAQLSGPDNVGKLVQFSLPSGWSWTSGSGSYTTDSNGFATVPAGGITANSASGTVAATSSSLTASTSVSVASLGSLQTNTSAAAFPTGSNADFVRMYASGAGMTAVKKNGDIWSWFNGGSWTQVGTGADTDAQRMSFIDASNTHAALWIKSGVLQVGSSVASIPSASNVDFVRVAASGTIALAVRSNGDLWRWDESTGWAKTATGVDTGLDKFACFYGSTKIACYWLAGGQLYSDEGLVNTGSLTNSNIVRITAARGFDANGAGLAVITANGDAWTYITPNPWVCRDSGVQTGPEESAAFTLGVQGGVCTLKAGSIWMTGNQKTGTNINNGRGPASHVIDNSIRLMAPSSNGQKAWYLDGNWMSWGETGGPIATGLGQVAAPIDGDVWRSPVFWIGPASSC